MVLKRAKVAWAFDDLADRWEWPHALGRLDILERFSAEAIDRRRPLIGRIIREPRPVR